MRLASPRTVDTKVEDALEEDDDEEDDEDREYDGGSYVGVDDVALCFCTCACLALFARVTLSTSARVVAYW